MKVSEKIRDGLISLPQYLKSSIGVKRLLGHLAPQQVTSAYEAWLAGNDTYDLEVQKNHAFSFEPLISILLPVYTKNLDTLKACIGSVLDQSYSNWQLCIADDDPKNVEVRDYLSSLEDKRIDVVFRDKNGGISQATNSAFELARGDYVGLLDDDDLLSPNTLFEVAKVINEDSGVELIYSDEDKIGPDGRRRDPYFKSDYARDSLLSNNYICHFLVFKRSLIESPLMDEALDGAQDYDLILRLTEKTDRIKHIPKILYHWRMGEGSTALDSANKDYAITAGKKAIERALKRRKTPGKVIPSVFGGFYTVEYDVIGTPKVSIIIPTKDNPKYLKRCVESILDKTAYQNYEILIVNNNGVKKETYKLFDELKKDKRVRVIDLPIPFNYSRINNIAAKESDGEYLLFLNDDTEVITEGWITKMLGYAQQPWIGAVGARLLFGDGTLQHAGVVVGLAGIAGHIYTNFPALEVGYFGRLKHNFNFTAVTAACLMIGREKFFSVGGFEEEIAVAFNDVDLCVHLADEGYFNICLANVELFHFESKSRGYETSAEKNLRFDKEKGRIRARWRDYIENDPMYNPNLTRVRGDYSLK